MAHIQRLYDFQPGTKILSNQVDAEFNQLINYVNRLDDANSALASTTGATKVGVSEGGNLQTLLDGLVRFATANIKYIRLSENKVIETSPDGVNWEATGSSGGSGGSGHLIQRANGTILPQRSRLQFTNTTILDDAANDRTVVQGIQGPMGPQGPKGDPGPGLPPGGTMGQIPVKISDTDYDTIWASLTLPIGERVARFTIGTSTAGWTEIDCDCLCDGTDDQEEIIAALTALPATGGEVVILDGTYNITESINIPKDNVSLRGNGNATTLKRMYDSTNTDSGPTAKGLITLNEKSGCKIQGLQIDGNKETYTASNNYGIYLDYSSNNTVTGNTCNNNNSHSIYLSSSSNNMVTGNTCNNNNYYSIYLFASSNNTVTGNTCNNNDYGINLYSSSNNTVAGNTCNNNSNYGIVLYSSSNNNIVTGNTCDNNSNYHGINLYSSSDNTVTGNTCNNNDYGINLYSSSNNTVAGNTCNNNDYGINLSSSSDNTVTGNTCIRGIGIPEGYTSSQYTIRLSGSSNNYNLIAANNCMGKAVVIGSGIGNSVWGNKFDDTDDLPEGVGDMMQAVYDPQGKSTDIFGYVDNKVKTDVPVGAKFTDTVYTHPESHPPSIIAQDASNRFVSDTEKSAWNSKAAGTHSHTKSQITDFPSTMPPSAHTHAQSDVTGLSSALDGKVDKVTGKGLSTEDYTTTEKNKLAGIEAGANNYTHPLSHPASMITDLPTGKKVARFVVGTSTAGWTAADCDYLCDGTADQVEINAAITALPATGGEIIILDGTYNIAAKINVTKDNVSIRGNGNATILKRMFDSSVRGGVITLTSRSGCKIANLQIDGNKESYTNSNNTGIYLDSSNNNTITGNTCNNNNYGIYLNASSDNNTVTGNTCNNNGTGIYLYSSNKNNTVTGNTCNNNNNYGIYLNASSDNNTVTGNTCCNNDVSGIYIRGSSNNTVTGNTCNSNSSGILLSDSSNNTITGNTCIRGTGLATDYTASQHTIRLDGTTNNYNLISNNNCMGKAVTNGGGTGNTLVNNKFDAT